MANEMQTSTMLPQAGQVFAQLLEQKKAPKGDLQTDFKTALYLCAATKHYTFEEVLSQHKLDILSFMLSSVGFKGSTSNIGIEKYLDTIQELLDEGALIYIGEGAGFSASGSSKLAQGEVSCARYNTSNLPGMYVSKLRFTDESGDVYPLFSKYLTIPGDKVKVVINTFLNAAYVVGFVKMRASLTGTIPENSQQIFFREKGFNAYDIRVTKDNTHLAPGSLVVAEIIARKSPNILLVKAHELKGDRGILDNFIINAILEHGITSAWPETVKRSAKNIPQSVDQDEIKGRVDLRNLPLVTIDGEDARDFDDAVYCQMEGDKFHLYVAIADVSYYVRTGSAIDAEALERTTSVYFPYFVVPMLPEELSNGICSLNPNVDRLCMVCDMIISKAGKIESYDFYPAVMNSHARLTYTEVHAMISEDKIIYPDHEKCLPWIKNLYQVYLALKKASDNRGVFNFESTEVNFLFDEHWQVKGMEPDDITEANQLIEECMIAANVCAATFVKENGYQSLYRIHDIPSEQKLDHLRSILSLHGIDLPNGYKPTPQDFKKVSDQVSKLPEGTHQVIALQMLRSMSKATYSPDNIGHFGLALENYSHFTSPIRRYPDLQIHRVIKYILEKKQKRQWGKIGSQQYSHDALVKLGTSCTSHEISAANAEYDVENSLKCEYLKNFIGEVVNGTVSTITENGAFITLNDFYIDGMLNDVYLIPAGHKKAISTGVGKEYYEGDLIKVRIAAVNSQSRFIDLLPVVNPRKKDVAFDIDAAKEYLKQQSVKDLKGSNQVKNKFLDSIGHFTRGVEAKEDNTAIRAHLDYSVKSLLNIEEQMEASKVSKASSKKQESSAKNETKVSAKSESGVKSSKKESLKAKKTLKEQDMSSAPLDKEENQITTVITVKRKNNQKGTAKTTVIALESDQSNKEKSVKSKSKKSDDTDPLLIDTASRIDADLGIDNKIKSTKNSKTSLEKTPKSVSKSSKSNAKSKQNLDDELEIKQESGSLTDNLTLAKEVKLAKPQTKTTKAKAKSAPQVDEVKDEDNKVESKSTTKASAKKTTTKASKAKSASDIELQQDAPKSTAKATAKKTVTKATTKASSKSVSDTEDKDEKVKSTAKTTAKKTATKASVKSTSKSASDLETQQDEVKTTAKAAAKKTASKATTSKSSTKSLSKSEAQQEALKSTAKAIAKKTASKATTSKSATKSVSESEAQQEALKSTAKTTAKKTAAKASTSKSATKSVSDVDTQQDEVKSTAKVALKKTTATKRTKKSVDDLESQQDEVKSTTKAASKKATATKSTAKKSATKSVSELDESDKVEAKSAVKKAATTKATVKKSTAKAQSVVKEDKETAKKVAVKKAVAKKTAKAKEEDK